MWAILLLLSTFSVATNAVVYEYTDSNFDENIAKHSVALVKFYAPWCGHCKRLAPEFDEAAKELAEDDPPVTLIKVDCTKETTVCGKVGVTGYPTLKIYKQGSLAADYEGQRSKDGIINYMRAHAAPPTTVFENMDQFEKLFSSKKPVVVGYINADDNERAELLKKVAAANMMDFKFGYTLNNVLPKSEKEFIRVYMHPNTKSKLEPDYYEYDGALTDSALSAWIKENAFGLVTLRTSDNDKYISRPVLTLFKEFDCQRNQKVCIYWINRLYKIAKAAKPGLKFAIADRQEMSYELISLGVSPPYGDNPSVAIFKDKSKYLMDKDFSWDNVKEFAENYQKGLLTPYLKSEEVPKDNSGPLKTLVAKNFDEIVTNSDKDVLIEFYAEWCGHCKALKPVYEKLANALKDEPGITIAAMEATKNDVIEPYEVTGFPTIYFAKKGNKAEPLRYTGGREFDDFIKYLSEKATDELVSYDRSGKPKKTEL